MRAVAALLLIISSFSHAEGLPPRPIVLKSARLFDGKAEMTVSPGLIVIRAGKIAGVGKNAPVPEDAEVIDLGEATLLPGVDGRSHPPDRRGERRLEAGRARSVQEAD